MMWHHNVPLPMACPASEAGRGRVGFLLLLVWRRVHHAASAAAGPSPSTAITDDDLPPRLPPPGLAALPPPSPAVLPLNLGSTTVTVTEPPLSSAVYPPSTTAAGNRFDGDAKRASLYASREPFVFFENAFTKGQLINFCRDYQLLSNSITLTYLSELFDEYAVSMEEDARRAKAKSLFLRHDRHGDNLLAMGKLKDVLGKLGITDTSQLDLAAAGLRFGRGAETGRQEGEEKARHVQGRPRAHLREHVGRHHLPARTGPDLAQTL